MNGDPGILTALRTTGTCRYFRPDPLPDEVLVEALDAARFAPQGGNLQPVRWLIVRDEGLKQTIAGWYLELWEQYVSTLQSGERGVGAGARSLRAADHFARHLAEVPALVIVCMRLSALLATDQGLGRLSVVGGASIYPSVQSFCLACRGLGVGTALTTLLCQREQELRTLLGIPEGVGTAGLLAVGYPARAWPRRLSRRPVSETAFADHYGHPLTGASR